MNQAEDYFLSHNKFLEEKFDYCIHQIDSRIDKLCELTPPAKSTNQYVASSYLQFRSPYIRDFRNFSGPTNEDVKQISELNGTEKIDQLMKTKSWSRDSIQLLKDAVFDHYSQLHLIELIKQRNHLNKQLQESTGREVRSDIEQKLKLIDEQAEQVKTRKEPRIFVPEDRNDLGIDWCAISAKLANTHHDAQDCRLMWSNKLHWAVNDGLWTKEEDACLLDAVERYGRNDWDSVAKGLNSNRLPWQCCARYQQEYSSACYRSAPINDDDTDKIIEVINLCRIGNFVPWNQVMYFIQYHSLLQVKYQWHKFLSERRSNQPWSHHEDVLLLKAIERFGSKDWSRIASYIPGRSNKSCRERYIMRLKFHKRAIGNWKRKEDERLLTMIEQYGTNWSLIALRFPERNNHQLRSRYELLKNDVDKVGPIKHRKLYRNAEGFLVCRNGRRQKPASDREVDEKLHEIFSTYQNVKPTTKSLVCRSLQDEFIYQNVIQVIRSILLNRDIDHNLLNCLIEKVMRENVSSKRELFAPCESTLRGYKAWTLHQEYLNKFCDRPVNMDAIAASSEYQQTLKTVMSLFLWPAILSRVKVPDMSKINTDFLQAGNLIERDSKNLYKIRELQKQIVMASHSTPSLS